MGGLKLILVLSALVAAISSLPLRTFSTVTSPSEFDNDVSLQIQEDSFTIPILDQEKEPEQMVVILEDGVGNMKNDTLSINNGNTLRNTEPNFINNLRPGMSATNYNIKLTPNLADGTFSAVARIDVQVSQATSDDELRFHFDELNIVSVNIISGVTSNAVDNAEIDEGVLIINTGQELTLYTFEIEYTGTLDGAGIGLYRGRYDGDSYLAMNLHPTNARRVFPCIDEPNIQTTISFTFAELNSFSYVTANSKRLDVQPNENEIQFQPLQGFPHLWGLIAHNMNVVNSPITSVMVYTRPGRLGNDQQSNVAINSFFTFLNEFTGKPHNSIIANQQEELHIVATPDINHEWYALSTIAIWEPYIIIEFTASAKQKQIGFVEIAKAMARQWFGYVMAPANWRHQWVISGLATYAGFEAARALEANPDDVARIDMDHIFASDIIRESLLYDSYREALPLQVGDDIFEEDLIRNNINGLLKTKAPAIIRMLSLALSENPEVDYVRNAAANLLSTSSLANVNSRHFYDTLTAVWAQATPLVDNVMDFIEPWVLNNNYPVIRIEERIGNGVIVTQERFGFGARPQMNFMIPLSFATRVNPDFTNVYPTIMLDASSTVSMDLGEDDWVIFNIQGQGYYRVNYDINLWEKIITAMEDENERELIHPINRAVLIDDALNLARTGRVDYSIAFRLVLTLNLETEYVVWKSFTRNMHMLRNHLEALVDDDEDLDLDIYNRIVRRIMMTAENDLSFTPEINVNERAMRSLSRGLIMDVGCRGGYGPCIAAAVDWFRNPTDNTAVNPNIPADIRPAVFCTNVRTGGAEERNLLLTYLTTITNQYERVVILESLGCSRDGDFIQTYLQEIAVDNSEYSSEEKVRICKAIIESDFQNSRRVLDFITRNTIQMRQALGGDEKFEEILYTLVQNLADGDMVTDYTNWVNSLNSNLFESLEIAQRLLDQVQEDMEWNRSYLNIVYEWLDENDAPTFAVSMFLLSVSVFMALFNH